MPEKLVIDCSVAAKWILLEPGRALAMGLLERWRSGELTLIAPDLLLSEFASLLAKRSRRKELSEQQSKLAFQLMVRSSPILYDMRPRLPLALDLSLQHQLSLWDAVYLALAIEHNCSLITADSRLFRSGKKHHPAITLLA